MIHLFEIIQHWLAIHTGIDIPTTGSVWYNFWSGFGSDIAEFALLGSLIAVYHHHNCAVARCPRIAHKKYEVKETKQYVCHKHHTQYWHDLLVKQYKQDYPEQHALINKDTYER